MAINGFAEHRRLQINTQGCIVPKESDPCGETEVESLSNIEGGPSHFLKLRSPQINRRVRLPPDATQLPLPPDITDVEVVEWVKDGIKDGDRLLLQDTNKADKHWCSLVADDPKHSTLVVEVFTKF